MKFIPVTSENNVALKNAKKFAMARHCREQGATLAEGIHLGQELLKRPELITRVFLQEGAEQIEEIHAILQAMASLPVTCLILPTALYRKISPVETSAGILFEIAYPQKELPLQCFEDAVYLDGVQEPGNVGSIIRTAVAAGIHHIALSPQTAFVWSTKALRAGMGSHFQAQLYSGVSVAQLKQAFGGDILVADARGGADLYQTHWGEKPSIWVFGSEGLGVSEASLGVADQCLIVPIEPTVESLNVGAAAAICLFEQRRRRSTTSTTA